MVSLKGFSLIELMVVIVIVAVLAAIAVPAYMNYKNKADINKSIPIAQHILQNVASYYQTHGSWPATIALNGVTVTDTNWTDVNFGNIKSAYYRANMFSDGYGAFIIFNLTGLNGITDYDPNGMSHSTIMFAIRDMGNETFRSVCGQNDYAGGIQSIPLSYLPTNCQCPYVVQFQSDGSGGC